jgi:drug/metabolite transporter (DMT)-like permease
MADLITAIAFRFYDRITQQTASFGPKPARGPRSERGARWGWRPAARSPIGSADSSKGAGRSADVVVARSGPTVVVAIGAMVLSAACWGLATVMSKAALAAFSPPVLLALQLVASVTFLWTAVGVTGHRVGLDAGARWAALSGLLEPGLAYAFGTFGLILTTAGNASLIATTEPLLIVALAWLVFREQVSARTVAAILAAIAGVAMVTGAHGAGGAGSSFGDMLVVLGTLFAAFYVVVSSRLVTHIAPVSLAALQQSVGLLFALVFLLAWSPSSAVYDELAQADLKVVGLALASGVVQYALAFWLYLIGLQRLSASTAALFLTLIPVFGLSGAMMFLNETVGLLQAIGAVTIIVAVASARRAISA